MTDAVAPLSGVRVLECGDTLAAAYAGRLLADLGADVVVVEASDGHPLRAVGPYVGASPGRERSAAFAYFAAGKRSVRLDVASVAGADAVRDLTDRADLVVRSTIRGEDLLGDEALAGARSSNPALIAVDVSTFGRLAGGDRHPTSDLLALAAGGLLSVNATAPGNPAATPLRYRGELAMVHAACAAVVAALGALFERRRSGLGQRIDVSAEAAVAGILATALSNWTYTGLVAAHDGRRGVAPWGFFTCADGAAVLLQVTEDGQWRSLVTLLGDPDWGHLEVFATTAQRVEVMDVLDPLVAEAIAGWTSNDFLAACHAHGVVAGRIHTAADLLAWEHLRAREYFQPIAVVDGDGRCGVLAPTPPWRYRGTAPVQRSAPPRLGPVGSIDAVRSSWPARHASVSAPRDDGVVVPAPLAGVRVVDLTWVWAGPYAAMQLAHLGAEVVKIESSVRLDVTRALGPWADGEAGPDRSGYYNQYNQGKQSVVLDLKDRRGRELLGGLLARADVVIDNMRAGALERMGFGYEAVRALNPRVVAVSMTGFGETGPERDRMAYGSLIDALSGVASSNGVPGGGPTDFPMSLPDPCAGMHTAIATLAALYRARVTGRGERVECSMLEASLAALPWPVLYQGVNGRPPPVVGNRDDRRAPHDVYRCRGTYEWLAIAVEDDAQFAALAAVVGQPALASDPRFASAEARQLHGDELDAVITTWTVERESAAAAAALRDAGVPAERVAHIDQVAASPTLVARDFFTELAHPVVGVRRLAGVSWRASRSPMVASTAAPCLGEHSRAVLARWLGLTADAIDEIEAAGVLR